ncbi:MAG: hypothetical protein ABI886_15755, partial [Betaproteobacteria bacterium]
MKPTTLPDRRAFAWRLFAAALPLLIAAAPAAAQINAPAQNSAPAPATAAAPRAADPDPVLIGNTIAQVRRSDYELELLRLP